MQTASETYYQSILSRIPSVVPVNEHLLQTLLLALVGHEKHVLIRTADDNVGEVLRSCVHILHDLLSLSVVKLKLRQTDNLSPSQFLRLLFLNAPSTLHPKSPRPSSSRKSFTEHAHSRPGSRLYKRSSSYPSEFTVPATGYHSSDHRDCSTPSSSPLHIGRQLPQHREMDLEDDKLESWRSHARRDRLKLNHSVSDPMPLTRPTARNLYEGGHQRTCISLPQVLIIAGLERSSILIQKALLKVLTSRQVALERKDVEEEGVWNLPDGFFMVCVSPMVDVHERATLHKSIIDRISMSSSVFSEPEVNNLKQLNASFMSSKDANDLVTPLVSSAELMGLQSLATPAYTHIHHKLDIYVADLFAATRHHLQLDGMLLTMRAQHDCHQLLRAWRVLFGPSPEVPENDTAAAPMLDASDDDVRDVFYLAINHRLRVRDGPREERLASAMFGAVQVVDNRIKWMVGRRSVDEILREILDAV